MDIWIVSTVAAAAMNIHVQVLFCFFFKDFLMWTIFKVFIEFVTILLLFYVFCFSGPEACGILAP